MNNFVILLASILTLIIAYVQCYNPEDMTMFFLGCIICIPAIVVSIVGIVLDKNFFEM